MVISDKVKYKSTSNGGEQIEFYLFNLSFFFFQQIIIKCKLMDARTFESDYHDRLYTYVWLNWTIIIRGYLGALMSPRTFQYPILGCLSIVITPQGLCIYSRLIWPSLFYMHKVYTYVINGNWNDILLPYSEHAKC